MLVVLFVVVLVLALLLALTMLVAEVVGPLLADARGRNPPRLVTRAGKNNAPKVVSAVVFVVAFVLLLVFHIQNYHQALPAHYHAITNLLCDAAIGS